MNCGSESDQIDLDQLVALHPITQEMTSYRAYSSKEKVADTFEANHSLVTRLNCLFHPDPGMNG